MKDRELSEKQMRNLESFLFSKDTDFYMAYIADLPLEEQAEFLKNFQSLCVGKMQEIIWV